MEQNNYENIEQLKKSSYDAFSRLYIQYSNNLYSFVFAQIKNSTVAEDIVQETFLKLWNVREQLDSNGNIQALIYTIARNQIIDTFRKQIVRIDFEDYHKACEKVSTYPTVEEQIDCHEFIDRVQQTKKRLPKRACQIYEMSREKNMPINEIAKALHLSSQTVKNYLTSTLKIFRKELKK